MDAFQREKLLLGEKGFERLKNARVAVIGLGGVGSYAAEAVIRAGVEQILLIDGDVVSETNLNRQLCALRSTIGLPKVQVVRDRMLDINPNAQIKAVYDYLRPDGLDILNELDYVLDAIDMITVKLAMAEHCTKQGIPIISCMGTGNKLNPAGFCVTDIFHTTDDPVARVMRRELRKRGVAKLKVVFSKEASISADQITQEGAHKPGSISFVPGAAGLLLAGTALREIAGR